jgi:hypothetical protein
MISSQSRKVSITRGTLFKTSGGSFFSLIIGLFPEKNYQFTQFKFIFKPSAFCRGIMKAWGYHSGI